METTSMDVRELNALGIPCYPDNDGGLWYECPYTHTIRTVKE